nr:nucleotidyltransferase substrate binding protein [uncultured Blautia sp.]
MRIHSVEGASTGSPREILQLGYKVGLQLFSSHCPARCFDMNMSKSRDIQAKMPSPKVIFYAFWLVTVKVLNSYVGFINDAEVWLLMLKRRNTSVHIWNEDEVNEMIILISDSFIPAFKILNETLLEKPDEAESDWR